jgi:hypothetical protein
VRDPAPFGRPLLEEQEDRGLVHALLEPEDLVGRLDPPAAPEELARLRRAGQPVCRA